MSHDAGQTCRCVAIHSPVVIELAEHHIWPLASSGPNTAVNRIFICASTHYSVHEILRAFASAGRLTSRQPHWPRYAYALAVEGWTAQTAGAIPPGGYLAKQGDPL